MSKEDIIEIIKLISTDELEYVKIIFKDSNSNKCCFEFDNDF